MVDQRMTPRVSIVIPVYNSEKTLEALVEGLASHLKLNWYPYEIILVDDGSSDGSWIEMRRLALHSSYIRIIRLSRNFGQHHAILAGVERAKGEITAIMDCDLQDQPGDVPRVLMKLNEGFDIVVTRFDSSHQSYLRKVLRIAYFRFISWASRINVEQNLGTMVAFNSKVRQGFLAVRDQNRHTNLVLAWLGFRRASVDIKKLPSNGRTSGYSVVKLIAHALSGSLSSSTRLLGLAMIFGSLLVAASLLAFLLVIRTKLLFNPENGWVSLMLIILLLGGMILFFLGALGFYVGKSFEQLRGRPVYLVDCEVGPPV
jgi:dolichol-phosphate mannosyltransferase